MSGMSEPWAKLAYDANRVVVAALSLLDHSLDVAATFAAILAGGAWQPALAATAGRPLTSRDIARLIVLVALHDIGKANRGFQARRNGGPPIGHEGQVAALLRHPPLVASPAGRLLAEMMRTWGAARYLPALMAHHGRPRVEFGRAEADKSPWQDHVVQWGAADGYDPVAQAGALIEAMRARWPEAWEAGDPLPAAPAFVSLFAGLVVLADWLGSDTTRFPVEGPYGAERAALRLDNATAAVVARGLVPLATPDGDFHATFGFTPHGAQVAATADLGPIALIEAETGSGKTEAALWRWLELRRRGLVDGLYFALPTRTAAVQLHARVQKMLDAVFGEKSVEAVLAVPGYLRSGDADGQALPGYAVRWDDRVNGRADDSRWAAERANRYLAARVAVGTIDQALLGALQVKHAHVRAASLSRSLLVVDEVHASDAFMTGLLKQLLANHVAAGGHALLLSATLGGTARAQLLGKPGPSLEDAMAVPYPALSGSSAAPRAVPATGRRKAVRIEVAPLIDEAEAIAARAVAAARDGAAVLVVRNSVRGAMAVAQAVEAVAPDLAFTVDGVRTLHHGRFAREDRKRLDSAVEAAFGKVRTAGGRILVGTQTLEQSLDIDADLLLTDLAPMDVLLQRIGRLHRHARDDRGAFAEPRVVVLRPAERDLTPLLARIVHGIGTMKDRVGPYPEVLQIEATLRLLEANPMITIPADNRRLVERALHLEALQAIATELGVHWINHANGRAGADFADTGTAKDLSLDLATPFRDLLYPEGEETVATRLGARDLLVDLDPAPAGPFGHTICRVAIPHFMARGVAPKDEVADLAVDADGLTFRLGPNRYRYDRWGLAAA